MIFSTIFSNNNCITPNFDHLIKFCHRTWSKREIRKLLAQINVDTDVKMQKSQISERINDKAEDNYMKCNIKGLRVYKLDPFS